MKKSDYNQEKKKKKKRDSWLQPEALPPCYVAMTSNKTSMGVSTLKNLGFAKAPLTVVTLSVGPVVPEVGVLLEVLAYACCSHPGTLQKITSQRLSCVFY